MPDTTPKTLPSDLHIIPIHKAAETCSALFSYGRKSEEKKPIRRLDCWAGGSVWGIHQKGTSVIKKAMAAAAVGVSVIGASAAMAPQAMAIGNDSGTTTVSGNNALQSYGNSATYGNMSPQIALIQGSFNKPCIALPAKANIQNILALVNVGIQDIPVLSSPQTQQCTENSTQAKGDEALSHILSNIPILSGNGASHS